MTTREHAIPQTGNLTLGITLLLLGAFMLLMAFTPPISVSHTIPTPADHTFAAPFAPPSTAPDNTYEASYFHLRAGMLPPTP